MVKIYKEIDEDKLELKINSFSKEQEIKSIQYSTCYYDNKTSKIWHCAMLIY